LTALGISSTLPMNPQTFKTRDNIMKKQVISISILQSSKIATALYVLMGFIYTVIAIPMIIFGNGQIRVIGMVYLFMPIVMGVIGFIFFVIFAAIYNLLASWLGGVEVEVKNIEG
jgi:ABC-type polysaccharide/polyol phosphate export permease